MEGVEDSVLVRAAVAFAGTGDTKGLAGLGGGGCGDCSGGVLRRRCLW